MKTACSNGNYRRINTTTWGSSSSCAVKTVENLFNVNIDYYAKVNFKGVVQLVEAVGGIDVEVPYSFCEQNSSRAWGDATIFVNEGMQHLNGEQALALARNRHTPNDGSDVGLNMQIYCPTLGNGNRNDYTRGKNQMKVILGVVKSATKLKDPNQAIEILNTIKSNFQTNVKTSDVLSLYGLAKSIVLNDSMNLVNVQRMQLNGYSVYKYVYDPQSKSYPAVIIPYKGSINDIKKEININLGKSEATLVKKISFDLNNLYEDTVIGQGKYSETKIAVLKDVKSYSIDQIKSYANSNGLSLKFIDVDTNKEVSISSYGEYKFYSQNEHPDTILSLVNSLTIYVKKNTTQTSSGSSSSSSSSKSGSSSSSSASSSNSSSSSSNSNSSSSSNQSSASSSSSNPTPSTPQSSEQNKNEGE
jgi:LCP family protein required for cell wall assembly